MVKEKLHCKSNEQSVLTKILVLILRQNYGNKAILREYRGLH